MIPVGWGYICEWGHYCGQLNISIEHRAHFGHDHSRMHDHRSDTLHDSVTQKEGF